MNLKLMKNLVDLLYPPACGICGKLVNGNICMDCNALIQKQQKNKLVVYKNRNFTSHFWIYNYEDEIRKMIIDYKFNDKSYIYRCMVELILKNKIAKEFIEQHDIIIPVPIHRRRKLDRGYNQCELIAKDLSKNIENLRLEKKIITKEKNISPQSTLDKVQRITNIHNAYQINYKYLDKINLKNKKILILDDVYTTGSTVDECAKLLKVVTNMDIDVLTFARD